ncbi:MAG TPA: S24 family peptidase [Gemmatimonadaceae bacterium]
MVHPDDGRRDAARERSGAAHPAREPLPRGERIDDALVALTARLREITAGDAPDAGGAAPRESPPAASGARADDTPARWGETRARAVSRLVRARAMAARMPVRLASPMPDERPALAIPLPAAVERAGEHGCAPILDLAAAAGAGRELWDAACESWAELPADLPRARYVALRVSGESMAPLMHSGDLVLVQLGTPLARDTVIVARRPGEGYVVKRVGRLSRKTVELLSLNPDFPPVTIPRDDRLVVGKVVMRWSNAPGG